MAKAKPALSRPTIYLTKREHVGPGLRQIRESQDLTQLDVAMAGHMDPSHMGSYERNRTMPSVPKLLAIMAAHRYAVVLVPMEECPEWVR